MSERAPAPDAAGQVRDGPDGGSLRRKVLIVVVVAGLLVAAYVFAVSVLPRWWSHQVGDQVDGDLTTGGLLGFMYGFLATFLPLLVVGLVWRFRRHSVWAWIVGVALALVLAAPNLITLGISIGNGNAAHAADRTLDVEAPWFRGGIAVGVAVGALLACYVGYAIASRSRARRRAEEAQARMEAERRQSEGRAAPPLERKP
jgi:hypothetical protein